MSGEFAGVACLLRAQHGVPSVRQADVTSRARRPGAAWKTVHAGRRGGHAGLAAGQLVGLREALPPVPTKNCEEVRL
jgi:hypothetical protein